MADYTADQFKEAARKAYANGDAATARSLIARAKAAEAASGQNLPAAPADLAEFSRAALAGENPMTDKNEWAGGVLPSPRQAMRNIKENLVGDNDPTTQNRGEVVGQLINKAIEGATFGLVGDEAAAAGDALMGRPYEEALAARRKQEEILAQNHPVLSTVADIGGSMAAPLGALGVVTKAPGMANLGARMVASGAAAGSLSGLYGFNEGEGNAANRADRAVDASKLGATVGAAVPLVGGAIAKALNARTAGKAMKAASKDAPDTESLRRIGNALYDQIDNAGVQVKASAFDRARGEIVDALSNNTAYTPRPGGKTITPNTSAVVSNMDDMAAEMAQHQGAALPFKEVDSLRRQAGAAAGNIANKSDQKAGMTIIEGLDDFVKNLDPNDVVAGDVNALKTALPKARDVWSRMSRSQLIDDAIANEGNYLSGGASAIRNKFASILRNKKLSRGFSEAERKAMQRVVSGSMPQQIINYLGSGLGMLGQMGLGVAAGGAPGAFVGAGLAAGSRKASEAMTRKNAEIARAIVANGGLKQIPQANPQIRHIIEKLLRQGTAGAIQ